MPPVADICVAAGALGAWVSAVSASPLDVDGGGENRSGRASSPGRDVSSRQKLPMASDAAGYFSLSTRLSDASPAPNKISS